MSLPQRTKPALSEVEGKNPENADATIVLICNEGA